MSERPKIQDFYCCAGGAAMGYYQAGFAPYGIDIDPQPRYPFPFHQGDALEVMAAFARGEAVDFTHPDGTVEWLTDDDFAARHGSPPCQLYTVANNIHGNDEHPDLLPPTREAFEASDKPWIIENVPGAPMRDYITLCGLSFGLGVKRHRQFETSFFVWNPPECVEGHPGDWVSVFGHTVLERGHVVGKAKGGGNTIKRKHLGIARGREAMGIDWMNRGELSEAIPPTYTKWLGAELLAVIEHEDRYQRRFVTTPISSGPEGEARD